MNSALPLDYAGARSLVKQSSPLSKATWALGFSAIGFFCLGFAVGIVAVVPWFLAEVAASVTYLIAIIRKEPMRKAAVFGVLVAWLPLLFVVALNVIGH